MKTAIMLVVVISLALGGAAYYALYVSADPVTNYREMAVKRGDLLSTITATGTVEPEEVVDVGAQVVGRIKSLGIDPSDLEKKKTIDYRSTVHEGTILALIDDATYQAQVAQAEASLARAKADVLQFTARYEQSKQEWKRAESLLPAKAIADTDYDLAVANYRAAEANVAVGKAVIKQSEAALNVAKTNLEYTIIKSPVEGVIIARRVNIGQTVVASLNAPSLFLIAKDLRRIQVWASVNETDIGRIHVGMPVRFTVDTYPGETFRGKVYQVRLNATMAQNVVTYTVVVTTDNPDGKLLPYLTANLQFEIEQRSDVCLVPNAALRWKPRPEQMAPDVRAAELAKEDATQNAAPPKPSDNIKTTTPAKNHDDHGRLWTVNEGFVRPIEITVGPSDGTMTEISGDGVREGIEVVIGEGAKNDGADETTNPFAPKIFSRPQPKKST